MTADELEDLKAGLTEANLRFDTARLANDPAYLRSMEAQLAKWEEENPFDEDEGEGGEDDFAEDDSIDATPTPPANDPSPPIRSTLNDWTEVTGAYRRKKAIEFPGQTGRLGVVDRSIGLALDALQTLGLTAANVTEDDKAPVAAELGKKHKHVTLHSAVKTANNLIDEALGNGIDEKSIVPKPPKEKRGAAAPPAAPPPNPPAAAKDPVPPPNEEPEELEEEFEDDAPPPPPRKSHKRQPQQPFAPAGMVMTPQGPMMAYPPQYPPTQPGAHRYPPARQAPVSPVKRVLGTAQASSTINIYKRTPQGERVYLTNVTPAEMQGGAPKFIREFIDPEHADPNAQGITVYECIEVNPNGAEMGAPALIKINSGAPTSANDPLSQAREALDFVNDLREQEEARTKGRNGFLEEAKQHVSKSGDINSMMMLMMMERFMGGGGGGDTAVLKVLEKIQQREQPFMSLPAGPPVFPAPPPPAAPSYMEKFMDAQLARMMEPPKSLGDTLKELEVFKTVLGGGGGPSAETRLIMERLAAIEAKTAPPAPGGLDAQLLGFEKLTTVVKALAPQMNIGGVGGLLSGLLTPKFMGMVAEAATELWANRGKFGLPASASAPQLPPGSKPVQVIPAPAAPPAPPTEPAMSQDALDAVNALRIAQTDEVKSERIIAGLLAMWSTPAYKPKLIPALKALIEGDNLPAQIFIEEWFQFARGEMCPPALRRKTAESLEAQLRALPDEMKNSFLTELGVPLVAKAPEPAPATPAEPAPAPGTPPTTPPTTPPVEVVKFPEGTPGNGAVPYMGPVPSTGPAPVQFVDAPTKA